jgi:predicted amidohydrolase
MIAVAQPPCVSYDVEINVMAHAAAIREAGVRLVVFPEMSLTGYELDAPTLTVDDARLKPIIEACAESQSVALVGGPADGPGGRPHIAILAVDGAGVTVAYRKMWLGGSEPTRFAAGTKPAKLEIDGWQLGLAICKDTGVPEHAFETAALGIDAYLAGVCELAEDDSAKDHRARRIATAHQVWVAVASFAGPTGGGFSSTAGRSAIWAPGGTVVAQAGAEVGTIVRATLY